jgi:2-dehydropantoate 2-reductase
MRYIVYGAGAIGGTVGSRLLESGQEVVFIARGEHGEAMRAGGLVLETPDWTRTYRPEVVEHPSAIVMQAGDAVLLSVKSQDTWGALEALYSTAPRETPLVSLQNGVDNERMALRFFPNVYGALEFCRCVHLRPGVVRAYDTPVHGVFDLGRYPAGIDAFTTQIVSDFNKAGFSAVAREDLMRWKYAKLLRALFGNAIDVVFGPDADTGDLTERLKAEAFAAAAAAGIEWASEEEFAGRQAAITRQLVGGEPYFSNSSWQSAARDTGRIESAYLNGEIVLLGRLHGVPTPVNELLHRCSQEVMERKRAVGSMSYAEFCELLASPV